eukprot:TRINITY_DN3859_c0_g1_i1.p1 TRINITY_DN3859_c0_g1~~TRINITY_DN3859_c0_g1_i1.p1  ORF type:complete len:474 (+),score=123.51 TRINITY_DN3859_c0_g1_i1:78-1424(+)
MEVQKSPTGAQAKDLNAMCSPLEAHRVNAVLLRCIEKLQLLSILSHEEVDVEEAAVGDGTSGVGAILENQRKMEQRYDELLKVTATVQSNPLDPVLDLTCFDSIDDSEHRRHKEELEKVSKNLKEYSRDLCRQLKENPNDSNNWNKVVTGRNELIQLLQSCSKELSTSCQTCTAARKPHDTTMSYPDDLSQAESQRSIRPNMANQNAGLATYESFAVKVIDDQNEQIWADDIVKREKETNQNVKTLQNDVALERGMKERELEERQQQLSELKVKVRKLRQESAENYDRKKGETEARAEAQARKGRNRQRELKEKIEMLKEQIAIEKQVHTQLRKHLQGKIEETTGNTKEWAEKQTDRQRQMEESYQNERKAKELLETRLHDATTMSSAEKQKRDLRRELDEKERQQKQREEDLEAAKREASTRLQAAFKAYLVRQSLSSGKKKGKKKK